MTAHDYHLIKIDERRHWREDIQGQTTAVYGVYAFNRNEHTYCCELTPSYCLMFVASDYAEIEGLSEEERDSLNLKILDGALDSEPVMYMHARDIEAMIKNDPSLLKKVEMDFDLDEDLDESGKWNSIFDQLCEGWGTGALVY